MVCVVPLRTTSPLLCVKVVPPAFDQVSETFMVAGAEKAPLVSVKVCAESVVVEPPVDSIWPVLLTVMS